MNTHSVLVFTPYWSTFGGGEKYVAALAAALGEMPGVSVRLLTTDQSISKSRLEEYFGLSLSSVGYEYVPGGIRGVAHRSADADLFVYMSNFQHIPSRARKTALVLQIPYRRITPLRMGKKLLVGNVREGLKDIARHRLLSAARSDIDRVVVYSQFVKEVLSAEHGIHATTLAPPIRDFRKGGIPKQNIILSVGRFFAGLYNEKRYDILLRAFREVSRNLKGWEYHIAGSAQVDPQSQKFHDSLREMSRGLPVFFHLNAGFGELQDLYNRARVFWHGAGYGINEKEEPERLEHFGMTTVEAMSAGCIPLVVPRGGQKEIIQHGINGFAWNTLDELVALTRRLVEQETNINSLSGAAQARSEEYSTEQFTKKVHAIFSNILQEQQQIGPPPP
jgi:glycosyltransferase involved in cell wall biosynthesis